MRHCILSMLLPAALVAPLCTVADAADTTRTGPASAIASLALSRTIFDEGVARGDAYMILAAASLRRSVPLDPAPVAAMTGIHAPGMLTWEGMLVAAEDVAAADPALMGVIADMRSLNMRGVSTGALFRNATLAPGGATEFEAVAFDGASAAEVYVEGVEASDLNLFVYDAAKVLICADEDASYIAHCYWEPDAPGAYFIKVVNGGAITSSYALITN